MPVRRVVRLSTRGNAVHGGRCPRGSCCRGSLPCHLSIAVIQKLRLGLLQVFCEVPLLSCTTVVDGLLFHDEWVLGVGIEVEVFAAVAVHALGGKDDTHSFVSSYGYEVSQRLIVETEHIVRFVVEVFQIIELVIDVLVTLKKMSGVLLHRSLFAPSTFLLPPRRKSWGRTGGRRACRGILKDGIAVNMVGFAGRLFYGLLDYQ